MGLVVIAIQLRIVSGWCFETGIAKPCKKNESGTLSHGKFAWSPSAFRDCAWFVGVGLRVRGRSSGNHPHIDPPYTPNPKRCP